MKTFTCLALAILAVTSEAGFTVLSPQCTIVGSGGQQLTKGLACTGATSPFKVNYMGTSQHVAGQNLQGFACDLQNKPAGCYKVTEALFGINPYGEEIAGQLFYNFLTIANKDGCDAINPTFSNPKNNNGVAFKDNDSKPTTKILIVDRGNCSFVRKVRMGQLAGAAAVIIMDNQYKHHKKVYMANDGSGDDIKIPSMFLDYDTGVKLKTALKTWGDNTVRISLDWALPESEGKVQWSLWTSAEDRVALTFKENFQLAFQRLGSSHQVFTPHFWIVDGKDVCRRIGANGVVINLCSNQCIYDGLYCAISSDPNLKNVVGKDIVLENFRQLCIFNVTSGINRDYATTRFWDYIDFFAKNCNKLNAKFSQTCSEKQMKAAKYTPKEIAAVATCTGAKYDFTQSGVKKNSILENELKQQIADGVFTIPTILVNNQHYRGGYTCPHPPQLASCGVLSAVCSAFIDGQEPPACMTDYCWDMIDDCGTCLKANVFEAQKNLMCCDKTPGKSFDSCGHCLNDTDPSFNKCYQSAQKTLTATMAGGIAAVFVILLLVIAGVIIAAVLLLRRKDQETRQYVDSVVSSYLPMEDEDDGNGDDDDEAEFTKGSTATL